MATTQESVVNTNSDNTVQRKEYGEYGGHPPAHASYGGASQASLYRPPPKSLANPAPLGLSAFALTTFVLSLINMGTRSIGEPNLVVAIAYGYGGLVQLLAGMWEIAAGNTFGATALSSYGGFWISFAIILTPGIGIEPAPNNPTATGLMPSAFDNSFGLYLMGWFIFTFILVLCTLKSSLAFFSLFFTLDMAFLLLGIGYLQAVDGEPQGGCIKAGGVFGILAALLAWYNALAGIADNTNSFFIVPVYHFPWSVKGRERHGLGKKEEHHTA